MDAQRLLPLLYLAAILTGIDAAAQVTLEGTVRDESSGAPIEGVAVAVLRAADYDTLAIGVVTDAAGRFEATLELATSVEAPPASKTDRYRVGFAHPNPATAGTVHIPYEAPLDVVSAPDVEVFDVLGRRVGAGSPLARGIYFYRLHFKNGHLSASRALVMAEAGVLHLQPTRTLASASTPAEAPQTSTPKPTPGTSAVAAKASSANDARVLIQVRRSGYKSVEIVHDLPGEGTEQVDFQLLPVGPLTAQFQVSGIQQAGSPVVFDASNSDGDIRTFAWDFGDGKRGSGQRVAHIFTTDGPYDVTLVVADYQQSRATTTTVVSIASSPEPSGAARLSGFVAGADYNPISGVHASVVGAEATAESDELGMLVLDGIPTDVPLNVKLSKTGYATGFVRIDLPTGTQDAQFEAILASVGSTEVVSEIAAGGAFRGGGGTSLVLPPGSVVDSQGNPADGEAEISMTPVNVSDAVVIGAFPGSFSGLEQDGNQARLATFGVADFSVTRGGGEELQLALGEHAVIELPLYSEVDQAGRPLEIGGTIPIWSLDEETGTWVEEGLGRVITSDLAPSGLALRAEVSHLSWWNCDISTNTEQIGLNFFPAVGGTPVALPPETSVAVWATTSADRPRAQAIDIFPLLGAAGVLIPVDLGAINITAVIDPDPGDVPPDELFVGELTIDPDASPVSGGDTFDIVLEPRVRSSGGHCESLVAGRTIRRGVEIVGDLDCFKFAGEEGDYVLLAFSDVQILHVFVGTIWLTTPGGEPIWQHQFGAFGAARRIQLPETGTYRLLVGGQGVSRGSYLLNFNLEGDCGHGETIETPSSLLCSIETNGDADTFVFDTPAAQTAVIETCAADFGGELVEGEVELWSQGRSPIASTSFSGDCGRLVTPLAAGRYEIRIAGVAGTGPYNVRLETPTSVNLDAEAAGNVAVPFSMQKWAFTLSAPTEVVIGTINESVGNFLQTSLLDGAGSLVRTTTSIGGGTSEIHQVLQPGTYIVEQDPHDNRTGTYRMVVRSVSAVADAPLNSFVDVEIDDSFDLSRHRFSLTTPETVVIGLKNASVGGFFNSVLRDESGQTISNATGGAPPNGITQLEAELPAGTYILEINPHDDLTGELSFVVRLIESPANADVNVLTSGSVTDEFSYNRYAVDVPQEGLFVVGTINESVGNFLDTHLLDSAGDGVATATASSGSSSEFEVELSTGTYVVELDPRQDLTGSYSFVMRRIAEPQEIEPGTEVAGQVTDPFDFDRYTFTLTESREVEIVTTNSSVGNFLDTELYDASGARIGQAVSTANGSSTVSASVPAGTYTVFQNPRGTLTGDYVFTVNVE